jgi:PilZ domain
MGGQKIRASRVRFDAGYPARLMAIDGTWVRDCYLEDVSDTGAKVSVASSIAGLNLSEFFLMLSRTGSAHRRCRMVWLKGDMVGFKFDTSKPLPQRVRATRPAGDFGLPVRESASSPDDEP